MMVDVSRATEMRKEKRKWTNQFEWPLLMVNDGGCVPSNGNEERETELDKRV